MPILHLIYNLISSYIFEVINMSVYLDLINGRNPEYSIATEGLKEVGAGIKKAFSNFVGKIIEWIDKVCQWFKNHKPESKKDLRKKNDELSKENAKLKKDFVTLQLMKIKNFMMI